MVNLENAVVARLEAHGDTFEVLLDPVVIDFIKQGKDVNLVDYMAVEDVFSNARKGTKSAEDKLKNAFGTDDIGKIAEKIITKGEIQVTAEQRKSMLYAKKRKIVAYIATNTINPQTRLPHPPTRIELALEECKFRVDPIKSVDKQVKEALRLLEPLLPIKLGRSKIAIKLKYDDYGKCYDELKQFGTVEKEEWSADGSWVGILDVPAGVIVDLTTRLNNKTRGRADIKLIS
ncbi:MAG: ribosome assembly factor SBDS [archaeon]|nr:ribosome assembly factor SBDS [archaeon]